ncbi:hypothetical protein [Kribbella amoyensis]|uniref:hypothetical protein n=1 Tax=Kribbella amoyensis TaxID=996641 RepID=UPI00119D58F6|nr:hypothetical protein [Kribbella amoyensis]
MEFWGGAYDEDPSYLRELERACGNDPRAALRLVAELAVPWLSHGHRAEAEHAAARVLAELGQVVPDGMADEYLLAVLLAPGSVRPEQVELAQQLAVELRRPFRHPVTVLLWATTFGPFEPPEVVAEILTTNERDGDAWTRAAVQLCIGYPGLTGASAAESEQAVRTALARFRMLGDRWGTLLALTVVASSGDELDEAVAIAAELGLDEEHADLLCRRAAVLGRADDYRVALDISTRAGLAELAAVARIGLARAARGGGDLSTARRHIADVLAAYPHDTPARDEALRELAALDAVQ